MAEIIHDVAPGADIAFYTAFGGQADFAQGIEALALPKNQSTARGVPGGGAQIIVDDVEYFEEPAFQSGIIGAAIDNVVRNRGVAYFSAAGNDNADASPSLTSTMPRASPTSRPIRTARARPDVR